MYKTVFWHFKYMCMHQKFRFYAEHEKIFFCDYNITWQYHVTSRSIDMSIEYIENHVIRLSLEHFDQSVGSANLVYRHDS